VLPHVRSSEVRLLATRKQTEWRPVAMFRTKPPSYLYWRERFWASHQWVYSLITASAGDALVI
jgi:hypothetical protein